MYPIILFSQHNHEVGFIFFPPYQEGEVERGRLGGGERIRERGKGDEEEEEE